MYGSISNHTFGKLCDRKNLKNDFKSYFSNVFDVIQKETCLDNQIRSCFDLFGRIHELTDTPETIKLVTQDVITDFVETDNVRVLELRSTLRELPSRRNYLESVIAGIRSFQEKNHEKSENQTNLIGFLPSIDRRRGVLAAEETVKLAAEFGCLGVDLSGDPSHGSIDDFGPVLTYAKKFHGLKLAVHFAEYDSDICNQEMAKVLYDIKPDRIGHGTEIKNHPEHVKYVFENKIPIESCLTSNLITKTVKDYDSHHFNFWNEKNHPLVICTDDKGVFNTSLNKEYRLMHDYMNVSVEKLRELAKNAVQYSFFEQSEKDSVIASSFQ